MDSEHRHELQENDLKEFLVNFNAWWNKYGTYALVAILIVVGSVVGIRWYKNKEIREREAAWSDVTGTSSPEGLVEVASRYADRPDIQAFARLRAADLLAEQAAAVTDNETVDTTDNSNTTAAASTSADQRTRLLNRSVELAKLVIDANLPANPSLVKLNARLRLAADYETLGQWDKAAEQYKTIRTEAGPFKTLAAQADQRLANIDTIKQPVVLPNAPEPKPEAEGKPADDETATPAAESESQPAPEKAPAAAESQPAPKENASAPANP